MAVTSLAVGAQAPDVTAPDEHKQAWRLSDALARATQVLVFYHGDW
jgi:peroxiredoxin